MKLYEIYTDGSYKPVIDIGTCAFIVIDGKRQLHIEGFKFPSTTNNQMELTGVIKALEWVEKNANGCRVYISTDSQYVQLGITTWIHNWKRKGWKTAAKKPVLNQELWRKLDDLKRKLPDVQFQWCRGHNGNKYNELVDQFCEQMYNQ